MFLSQWCGQQKTTDGAYGFYKFSFPITYKKTLSITISNWDNNAEGDTDYSSAYGKLSLTTVYLYDNDGYVDAILLGI